MSRPVRKKPADLTPAWPDEPIEDPIGEVARGFALRLREAVGGRSVRAAAAACQVSHATVLGILEGRVWPDLVTIARLERGLEADLWPGWAVRG